MLTNPDSVDCIAHHRHDGRKSRTLSECLSKRFVPWGQLSVFIQICLEKHRLSKSGRLRVRLEKDVFDGQRSALVEQRRGPLVSGPFPLDVRQPTRYILLLELAVLAYHARLAHVKHLARQLPAHHVNAVFRFPFHSLEMRSRNLTKPHTRIRVLEATVFMVPFQKIELSFKHGFAASGIRVQRIENLQDSVVYPASLDLDAYCSACFGVAEACHCTWSRKGRPEPSYCRFGLPRGRRSFYLRDTSAGTWATRKPRLPPRNSGVFPPRCADQQFQAMSYQLPPRRTRVEPLAGPFGSSSGETA